MMKHSEGRTKCLFVITILEQAIIITVIIIIIIITYLLTYLL
jgi:hypothetical protein